jgi:hypothetical protein
MADSQQHAINDNSSSGVRSRSTGDMGKAAAEAVATATSPRSLLKRRSATYHRVTHFVPKVQNILDSSGYNKSTAFSAEEREMLKLRGLLPPCVETLEAQVVRCASQLESFDEPINRYIYLDRLKEQNETLFYRVLMNNITQTMPIIYTVGWQCVV